MIDTIEIKDLEVFAHHGVYPEETRLGQKFYVSAKLFTDFSDAAENDDLTMSIDYGDVCKKITDFMTKNNFKLIETVAKRLCEMLLYEYNLLTGVEIQIKKPWAPIGFPLDTILVKTKLFWHTAYIALGSNMGDKEKYINDAINALCNAEGCKVKKVSDLIITPPYGDVKQDDFLNGVLCLKTVLSPKKLLSLLNEIEKNANRDRKIHWGPRTLDLDIILYDNEIIDNENLHIPHIDMQNREFVLKPLCQVAPFVRHPVLNKTAAELLKELSK